MPLLSWCPRQFHTFPSNPSVKDRNVATMLNAQASVKTEEEPLLSMAEPSKTLRNSVSSVDKCCRAKGCLGKKSLQHAIKHLSASDCNR